MGACDRMGRFGWAGRCLDLPLCELDADGAYLVRLRQGGPLDAIFAVPMWVEGGGTTFAFRT